MRRYNQRLYRAVRAILENDADAEDAVQQTYLNIGIYGCWCVVGLREQRPELRPRPVKRRDDH